MRRRGGEVPELIIADVANVADECGRLVGRRRLSPPPPQLAMRAAAGVDEVRHAHLHAISVVSAWPRVAKVADGVGRELGGDENDQLALSTHGVRYSKVG